MRNFKKTKNYEDKTSYINDSTGKPSKEGKVSIGIAEKAMRNLPKSSYSIKADPYTAALPSAKPYPIIDNFNKSIGGKYSGLDNLDGGNAQQYTNSVKSGMLDYADFGLAILPMNYRNIPLNNKAFKNEVEEDNYCGQALIDEMIKSISESTSLLQSTTFTQMQIYDYVIETDMPIGSSQRTEISADSFDDWNKDVEKDDSGKPTKRKIVNNLPEVIYCASMYYQLVQQTALNVFNWHNSCRLKMGTMIRRSWNRETPTLNGLFGLLKKKSFLSFLDSIALSFEGEYLDLDEMRQINMLTLIPSARSNAITDPVLELGVTFNRPSVFKVYIRQGDKYILIFDQNDEQIGMKVKVANGGQAPESTDYFTIADDLIKALSAEQIMLWARTNATTPSADTAYYNKIKWKIDGLANRLTFFKTVIADIREVFDTMSRTGTVSWEKGYKPTIVKDTDADIYNNLIINDIYKIMASSADKVDFNDATKRWRTFSQWNMYSGIPEYDTYQGGSFLTLSLKTLDVTADSDGVHKYLPIRFTRWNGIKGESYLKFHFVTRKGKDITVLGTEVKTMSTDPVLSRLVPLQSQAGLQIRIPSVVSTGLSANERSCIYKTLTQIFGSAMILTTVGGKTSYDIALDPDIISIYQIELEDITNEAITYARSHSPFKGTTSTVDILGFKQ